MCISPQTFFIKNLEYGFSNIIFAFHKQAIRFPPVFLYWVAFKVALWDNKQTTMITPQLRDGQTIFNRVLEFAEDDIDFLLSYLDTLEPPESWVLELPSAVKNENYKTLPIDIMEGAAKLIFGSKSRVYSIGQPIITQDKSGRYAATVSVQYYLERGEILLPGVATVTSPNIQGLELAVPKASSMAVKNAIKQLGGLFGKYLNRVEEDVTPDVPQTSIQEEIDSLPDAIKKVQTLEDLKTYHKLVYSKSISHEVQAIYEQKFRELKGK